MRAVFVVAVLMLGCGEAIGQVEDLEQTEAAAGQSLDEWSERDVQIFPPARFEKGGQVAWFHDSGDLSGYWHTYDALQACGAGDAPRKVHVFLPRTYERSTARYPVVYLQDGNTAFWPGGPANDTWRVQEGLSTLWRQRAIEPVIVVAVHPLNRDREYTHASAAPGRDCCGAEAYTNYLADCVKRFVDTNYRTVPDAARTAVIGSSHGGLISFYAATRRPDRFGRVGALSSSFWVGLDPLGGGSLERSALVAPVLPLLRDPSRRPNRIWIDWGLVRDGGFHNVWIEARATERGRELAAALERTGYVRGQTLFVQEDPRGAHQESSWARRFPDVMRALYPR
ncbi:MAG: alpha/beta hydrolase-fold protein [Myxococcaceae bacterium]|nr:alpha/beta hydrolase-fold protein [Myxococcaceae bacterium]